MSVLGTVMPNPSLLLFLCLLDSGSAPTFGSPFLFSSGSQLYVSSQIYLVSYRGGGRYHILKRFQFRACVATCIGMVQEFKPVSLSLFSRVTWLLRID